jgi:hypothetical protein
LHDTNTDNGTTRYNIRQNNINRSASAGMRGRTAAAVLPVPKPSHATAPAIPAVTGTPARTLLPNPCPWLWRKGAHCRQLHSSLFVVVASSCHATGRRIMGSNWCAGFAGCAGVAQRGAAWVRITRLTCALSRRPPKRMQQQRLSSTIVRSEPPYEACPRRPLGGPSSSRAGAQPDSRTAAAATACFGHVGHMIFVSNRTSRHWDVLFDRTTVDMSTDGRNLARGIPWGAREAMGPVRRAIPGQRAASARCALFCNEIYDKFRYMSE